MSYSASSVKAEGKLHFDIEHYHTESNPTRNGRLRIGQKLASALMLPSNSILIDSANCRGMILETLQRSTESRENYEARSQKMEVWVLNEIGKTKLIISYYKDFKSDRFIEVFNEAVNDMYNEKMRVTLSSAEGYYGNQMHLYTEIYTEINGDELVIFGSFKKMLVSSTAFHQRDLWRPLQTKEAFEKDLDTLFGIDTMKRKSNVAEIERLFVAKDFDALYGMILSDCMLPVNKGRFLAYGERLRKDGDYQQAIRFLNAEHPSHMDTHDKAQMQVFEILGDILVQDSAEPFLDEDERRQYKRNRIELAHKLEKTNPTIADLADKLFCDYAGYPVVGQEPRFSLKTDPFELALELADALNTERMRNLQLH